MPEHYYRIMDDVNVADRWFLKSPRNARGEEIDPRVFTKGVRTQVAPPLFISQRQPGRPLGFTFADFGMPVVRKSIGELLRSITPDSVQLIPAGVDTSDEEYDVLNVTCTLPCLDEQRSEVEWWTATDGRPEKIGQYRGVRKLLIDRERVVGHGLFRIKGWEVALIASASMRKAMEEANVTGVIFLRVTA